ncbi:acetyl-CoA carboxylase biotin carboxylase subunit [Bythopirellula polymerisocia]|uniref:propionyl-CoA carboxylase n=1 Tax=Bythopirellula polymerisocia TaxID=2528003 RepID=A0A5C6D291_9BACT|nr:acetyl-CoA carboxylase biotin carboxylase subunit [Bythopirellula polymerisocia]TWU29777.1 Acetyl-/propionyl-coenzyme A carboxylase alpha chain [Bythopirellula polymerisocia]
MFKKILIANRGEIACRVIKSARKMGIATVAVYSEADKDALHVALADEAVCIGPAPSSQSYLVIDRILEACRTTGADAVHPGYGFLSENAEFAKQLDLAGIAFIGPGIHAITSMGDKITSKRLAQEAGVNTVPGSTEVIRDGAMAVKIAKEIGYPVMLKASAGGGGKGMRVAFNDEECREGFERASNESRSSFGDDRIFIEKFIEQPRHIEIQVLGDTHGNIVFLGERECSLQRRHQKIIEEAPSPFIDKKTRALMGEQAVALARAVQYHSAGTVEFIVDAERNFYFLEMNTRLQVEHPVTEFVTGLDLVELMIRIAAGESLQFSQTDVKLSGWAIEARIYAEDPFRNFLPSVGRLVRYAPPAESDNVRVDTGVYEGGEVSIHYDPMIAKLITYGADREESIQRMRRALNEFTIRGVAHNISFLGALVNHPRFAKGQLSTNLIAEEYPDGFDATNVVHDDPALLITVCGVIHRRYRERAAQISGQLPGYEPQVDQRWVIVFGNEHHPVTVCPAERGYDVTYADLTYHVESNWEFGQPLFRGSIDGEEVCVQVERRHLLYRLFHWGTQVDMLALSARAAELLSLMPVKEPPDLSKLLLSPMPGMLASMRVEVGEEVKAGQDLAVVEAMKMENVLRAERDGKVANIVATVGETLAVDQVILEFE